MTTSSMLCREQAPSRNDCDTTGSGCDQSLMCPTMQSPIETVDSHRCRMRAPDSRLACLDRYMHLTDADLGRFPPPPLLKVFGSGLPWRNSQSRSITMSVLTLPPTRLDQTLPHRAKPPHSRQAHHELVSTAMLAASTSVNRQDTVKWVAHVRLPPEQ